MEIFGFLWNSFWHVLLNVLVAINSVVPNAGISIIIFTLMMRLLTEAIARGAKTLSLEVRVTNLPAQSMYGKFGFSVVGVRKGYYIETKEDALVMVVDDATTNEYRLRLESLRDEIDAATGGSSGGSRRIGRGRGGDDADG